MKINEIVIGNAPCVVYGDDAAKVYLYIHGKCGCKEEAEPFSKMITPKGFQVVSVDLPETLYPWECVPIIEKVMEYIQSKYESISLYANSIGAWFSLTAFQNIEFHNCIMVSPVVDMDNLICNMMQWANVTLEQLESEKEIKTDFGETLSWRYYRYVKEHPIVKWSANTHILYAGQDNLTPCDVIENFAERLGCELTVMENGEHWFHTEEQVEFLNDWLLKVTE